MRRAAKAECPQSSVRCKPTPSFGFSRASATASSHAGSFTIRLAVVRMPSRWARMTAWLIEAERPKSSALTISRRRDRARARRHSLGDAAPETNRHQERRISRVFCPPVQARQLGAEDVEPLRAPVCAAAANRPTPSTRRRPSSGGPPRAASRGPADRNAGRARPRCSPVRRSAESIPAAGSPRATPRNAPARTSGR